MRSFCILNEILYLSTSDLGSLMALLAHRGLDSTKADQGRIHHTSPEDFLIICSPSTEILVKDYLSNSLKGRLHFEGAEIQSNNKVIKKVEYIPIESVYGIDTLKWSLYEDSDD